MSSQEYHDRQTERIQRNIKQRARSRKYSPDAKMKAFVIRECLAVRNKINTMHSHFPGSDYFEFIKKLKAGS